MSRRAEQERKLRRVETATEEVDEAMVVGAHVHTYTRRESSARGENENGFKQ